jgi:hypothetical protein
MPQFIVRRTSFYHECHECLSTNFNRIRAICPFVIRRAILPKPQCLILDTDFAAWSPPNQHSRVTTHVRTSSPHSAKCNVTTRPQQKSRPPAGSSSRLGVGCRSITLPSLVNYACDGDKLWCTCDTTHLGAKQYLKGHSLSQKTTLTSKNVHATIRSSSSTSAPSSGPLPRRQRLSQLSAGSSSADSLVSKA